jgi:hypothetical protein
MLLECRYIPVVVVDSGSRRLVGAPPALAEAKAPEFVRLQAWNAILGGKRSGIFLLFASYAIPRYRV